MPLSGSLCTPKSTPIKLGLSVESPGAQRPSVTFLRSSPHVSDKDFTPPGSPRLPTFGTRFGTSQSAKAKLHGPHHRIGLGRVRSILKPTPRHATRAA